MSPGQYFILSFNLASLAIAIYGWRKMKGATRIDKAAHGCPHCDHHRAKAFCALCGKSSRPITAPEVHLSKHGTWEFPVYDVKAEGIPKDRIFLIPGIPQIGEELPGHSFVKVKRVEVYENGPGLWQVRCS